MEITPTLRKFLLGYFGHESNDEYKSARIDEMVIESAAQGMTMRDYFIRYGSEVERTGEAVITGCREIVADHLASCSAADIRSRKVENRGTEFHRILCDSLEIADIKMLRFYKRLMTHSNVQLLRIVFIHATNFGIPAEIITSDNVDAYGLITYNAADRYDTEVPQADADVSDSLIVRVLTDEDYVRHVLANAPSFIEDRMPDDSRDLINYLDETLETQNVLTRGHL